MPAEWHFAWALGGRAIQDVWTAPSREARERDGSDGEWGTTIRCLGPEIDAWRSTWLGPLRNVVMPFIGRQIDDEIVLEGSFEEGVTTRWIFSEITPDSFSWRNVDSADGGETWTLNQEMKARRVGSGKASRGWGPRPPRRADRRTIESRSAASRRRRLSGGLQASGRVARPWPPGGTPRARGWCCRCAPLQRGLAAGRWGAEREGGRALFLQTRGSHRASFR